MAFGIPSLSTGGGSGAGVAGRLGIVPTDLPRVRMPGPDPIMVLLYGDGSVPGRGEDSHQQALAGGLVCALDRVLNGRGVRVDVLPRTAPLAPSGLDALLAMRPERYDIVLIGLDYPAEPEVTPADWARSLERLLRSVEHRTGGTVPVVVLRDEPAVSGVTRSGRSTTALVETRQSLAETACRAPGAAVHENDLPAGDAGGERRGSWYARRSDQLALATRSLIEDVDRIRPRDGRDEEMARQAAVWRSTLLRDSDDPLLRQIVQVAQAGYEVELAGLQVLGPTYQHVAAYAGPRPPVVPRELNLCDHVIAGSRPLVFEDVSTDARFFLRPPQLADGRLLRFYAGVPVESPDGYRIGALCVADTAARRVDQVDTTMLQAAAALIERRIWELMLQQSAAAA